MTVDNELNPVLGIYLGTTFSAIARWDGQSPKVYQTRGGGDKLPSAVYYDPEREDLIVGEVAYRRGLLKPENVALGINHDMDHADEKIVLGGREFTSTELYSLILGRLYQDVKENYDAYSSFFSSRGTVVTVPFYFKAHQCENVRKAAELADINCIGILQEPIAACLGYTWQLVQGNPNREGTENILVFDLGCSRLDLTLLKLEQTKQCLIFEVLATDGDERLGGINFDECLADLLLEKSDLSLEGLSEKEYRKSRLLLLYQANEAKENLSTEQKSYVAIANIIPRKNIDLEISRSEFEGCIHKYLNKIERIFENLCATANLEPSAIDRVIFSGGSSRIPRMRSLLSDLIGRDKLYSNTNLSLCIAEGAAMYAAYLDDRKVFGRDIKIINRTYSKMQIEETKTHLDNNNSSRRVTVMTVDNEKNPVLGIDLGTTFSAIARWDGQGTRAYQTSGGQDTLQSVVYYEPDREELIVGQVAYKRGVLNPENVAIGVKREMDHANKEISLGDRKFSPIELSSLILKRLYSDVAQKFPNGDFSSRGTVVTVPYYFKANQCENTRKAAQLADINCVAILQEPIAASLSYTWQLVRENPEKERAENILVFDLGGGTFDLTLFKLEQTKQNLLFEVLATGGDDRLGGMDFDECLSNLLLKKSNLSLEGLSEKEYRKSRLPLLDQANYAKENLSAEQKSYVTVPYILPGKHIDLEIARAEFEGCIQQYFNEIQSIIEKLFATANFEPSAVDRVILAGGSSRIPRMKSLLEDLIGRNKVYANTNPSLCVAEGAAMYAAYLDDREVFGRDITIISRTCHALGVEIAGGKFERIIPANAQTPCDRRKIFGPGTDNATEVNINIYQGSAPYVKDNTLIGTLKIPDLPQKSRDDLNILVTFKVNMYGTVSHVECRDANVKTHES